MSESSKYDSVTVSLKLMEQSIKRSLSECELWGDLNYSKDDYDHIHNMVEAYVEELHHNEGLMEAIQRFPYSFITDIIGLIIYEYDGSGIWSQWFGKLGLETNGLLQTNIGKFIRHVFDVNNLEIVVDGGHVYVTPILYQAGVPNFTLRRLYDLLYYTVGSPYFSESEFYDEVTGYRNYLLDSTGVRYFKNVNRAMDLISDVRSIIETMDDYADYSEIPMRIEYEDRYVQEFFNWRKSRKDRSRKSEKGSFYYVSPKVYFDDLKGVSLRLPSQIINDESVDVVLWEIECEDTGEILSVSRPVYYENRMNKIEEALVPLPPSSSYTITMLDQDNPNSELYKPWKVVGLDAEVPYMIFSVNSKSQTIGQLSQKGSLLIRHKDTSIMNREDVDVHQHLALPQKWNEYRAELISPKEQVNRIQISFNGQYHVVDVKRSVDLKLVQLSTLFDEQYSGTSTPVYISLPVIEVEETLAQMDSLYYKTWKIQLRNKSSNQKMEFAAGECDLRVYENSVRLFLPDEVKERFGSHYGEYEIKFYFGRSIWSESFYLVPEITYQGELIYDEKNPYLNSMSLKIRESEEVTFEFDKENRVEKFDEAGERWIRIFGIRAKAFIRGVMKVDLPELNKTIQVPFRKRTGKIEWKFWDENENTESSYGRQFLEDTEIQKGNWICFMSLFGEEENVEITLESGKDNEILQSRTFYKDRNGIIKVPLNGFVDTMKSEKLPQKIMCYIGKEVDSICLCVIGKVSILKNLQYRKKGDKSYIIWDNPVDLLSKTIRLESVSDPNSNEIRFEVNEVKTLKFGEIFRYGLVLPEHPDDGLYMLNIEEEIDDFFFEEDEKVFTVDQEKFLKVMNKAPENFEPKEYKSIAQWAKAYLSSLADNETIKKIHHEFLQQIKKVEYSFREEDQEVFIRLVMVVQDTKYLDEDIAGILREFFSEVNIRFITNKDRAMLLKRILKGNFSREDFIKMEYELQLFLVERNPSVQLDREEMRKLWQLDEKLAILVSLRDVAENKYADTLKILNHLNAPMIRKMIVFKPSTGCSTESWMDCFENVVTGKCHCRNSGFPGTEKFWGDVSDFHDSIVSYKNDVNLKKLSEIPSDGYEFLGSNYLSLCYRWITDNHYKDKDHWKKALDYESALLNVSMRNLKKHKDILRVLQRRIDGNSMTPHRFFYMVGVGAILEASGEKESPMKSDLRRIHRFWDHAFRAFPKLVMRDLIISELYMKFN